MVESTQDADDVLLHAELDLEDALNNPAAQFSDKVQYEQWKHSLQQEEIKEKEEKKETTSKNLKQGRLAFRPTKRNKAKIEDDDQQDNDDDDAVDSQPEKLTSSSTSSRNDIPSSFSSSEVTISSQSTHHDGSDAAEAPEEPII